MELLSLQYKIRKTETYCVAQSLHKYFQLEMKKVESISSKKFFYFLGENENEIMKKVFENSAIKPSEDRTWI